MDWSRRRKKRFDLCRWNENSPGNITEEESGKLTSPTGPRCVLTASLRGVKFALTDVLSEAETEDGWHQILPIIYQ